MSCSFAFPHHLNQILRNYSPAETDCALSVTPLCLLANHCHVGHKSARHLHVYGGACTLVATTGDIAVINMAVNKLFKLSENIINSVSETLQYLKIQDQVLKPWNKTDALPDFVCGLYISRQIICYVLKYLDQGCTKTAYF